MVTFHSSFDDTVKAAEVVESNNERTHIRTGEYRCACGMSFACKIIDSDTLNVLETHVYCESCALEN